MDERLLTERLVGYDTSTADGLRAAGGFVKGWLESHGIDAVQHDHDGLPVLLAEVGPARPDVPTVIFHGHLDVVPASLPEQFTPALDGDRLYGRGTYDMKGGLAAMMCAFRDLAVGAPVPAVGANALSVHPADHALEDVRVKLVIVPDEESEQVDRRSTETFVNRGLLDGDFAITGEPTELQIGVQAKGVLAVRAVVTGTSAHGSTPWLGDNAIHKAMSAFRRIESLPFSRQSSELYDRPSINLARVRGGDAFNMVPDRCEFTVDIRYVPGQDPDEILAQIAAIPDLTIERVFRRAPAIVARDNPFVRVLQRAAASTGEGVGLTVGRDGASDAIAFLDAGIPAVEFGPSGNGHHGPDEWVSVRSLAQYRRSLVQFVRDIPNGVLGTGASPRSSREDATR